MTVRDRRKYKLLCVDDEAPILAALRRVFVGDEWEVLTAGSAAGAMAMLSEHEVDLILCDYRMPGMNGVELLKRAGELQPESIRIVLSGSSDADDLVPALRSGDIYRFVAKPWRDDDLVGAVRLALEYRAAGTEADGRERI